MTELNSFYFDGYLLSKGAGSMHETRIVAEKRLRNYHNRSEIPEQFKNLQSLQYSTTVPKFQNLSEKNCCEFKTRSEIPESIQTPQPFQTTVPTPFPSIAQYLEGVYRSSTSPNPNRPFSPAPHVYSSPDSVTAAV